MEPLDIEMEFDRLQRVTYEFHAALALVRELRDAKRYGSPRTRVLLTEAYKQAAQNVELAAQAYLHVVKEVDDLLATTPDELVAPLDPLLS